VIPGSNGFWDVDANAFAIDYAVDGIKADWCGVKSSDPSIHEELTTSLAIALNNTGKPVYYSFHCNGSGGGGQFWSSFCALGSSSRISHDHYDSWEYTNSSIEGLATFSSHGGLQPSGGTWWLDPDYLMTGGAGCTVNSTVHCPVQSDVEYRTAFSFWSLTNSLLIFDTDPRNLTAIMYEVLFNTELIAVNQDPLAHMYASVPAKRVQYQQNPGCPAHGCELWHKVNSTGFSFVILYNGMDPTTNSNATISLSFQDIGFPAGTNLQVRDLWAHSSLGTFTDTFVAQEVQPHEARTLSLIPA
jgi:alpha-galactosidase